ncbi:MarR family winged helix-turn-helix transcriptional regulator [Paraglaciecola arctica]|uniref:MarR family winged helix-turn-helix transcriptional regulator n=1 Tax=Paraglaciecola arctica TaxID=1128911 RepID=UPI001C07D171|nr:MarR family transcriptional regulator [Paraglaciecola arctica]MBU3001904.1 MarR family transcriptional regulator [Paraglaciecola arctica]
MQNLGSDVVDLKQFIPYKMVHLAAKISVELSKIYKQEFDVSIPEWRVLAQLALHKELYSKDIGELTAMDKSKVSRAVKVLEDKNYLRRKIDEHDNRAAYLALTSQGLAIYQKIAPKALQWEKQLIDALETSEHKKLIKILDQLEQQLVQISIR